jgi:hypothetical protein
VRVPTVGRSVPVLTNVVGKPRNTAHISSIASMTITRQKLYQVYIISIRIRSCNRTIKMMKIRPTNHTMHLHRYRPSLDFLARVSKSVTRALT